MKENNETPQDRWAKKQEIKTIGFKLYLAKEEDREVLKFFEDAELPKIDMLKKIIKFYKDNN